MAGVPPAWAPSTGRACRPAWAGALRAITLDAQPSALQHLLLSRTQGSTGARDDGSCTTQGRVSIQTGACRRWVTPAFQLNPARIDAEAPGGLAAMKGLRISKPRRTSISKDSAAVPPGQQEASTAALGADAMQPAAGPHETVAIIGQPPAVRTTDAVDAATLDQLGVQHPSSAGGQQDAESTDGTAPPAPLVSQQQPGNKSRAAVQAQARADEAEMLHATAAAARARQQASGM